MRRTQAYVPFSERLHVRRLCGTTARRGERRARTHRNQVAGLLARID
jgi:hypothetical protein